jgi:tyrosinase
MGSLTTTKKNKTANSGLDKARKIPPVVPVITGPFEISINNATSGASYVGWSLAACSIRITNQPQPDLNVILTNRGVTGGQVIFRANYGAPEQNTLLLTLPGNATPVNFFVGGKFNSPSVDDQDGGISVTDAVTNNVLHQRTLMVRIRKNANTLTAGERDRLLYAYAALNGSAPDYQGFLDSHNNDADPEIHGRPAFLPWHRAFVLHIERRLQFVDSSVALPYWRFDQPAPNLFTADFMGGTPNGAGRVPFSASNPLKNWAVNGVTGVVRVPGFNTAVGNPTLRNQNATLALGTDFVSFRVMEGNPHGSAHVSFTSGPIRSPPTATQDPIFFLLHCNVDRLWARWQLANDLWNPANAATYSAAGSVKVGDAVADTMWPWNGATGGTRPPTAPGGPLPQLSFPSKPSPSVTVGEVIDYIGKVQGNSNYFDYDDIPFL